MSSLLNASLVTIETLSINSTILDPVTREVVGSRNWQSTVLPAQVMWTSSQGERFTAGGHSGVDPSSAGYLVCYYAQVKARNIEIGSRITSIAGESYELFVNRLSPMASLGGTPQFIILYFQDKPLR